MSTLQGHSSLSHGTLVRALSTQPRKFATLSDLESVQGSGDGKFGVQWSFVSCPGAGRKLIEEPFQGQCAALD